MKQSSNWVKIHEDFNCIRAEILKNYLTTEHQIPAVVMNKQDSSYHFGKCEILVLEESKQIAIDLIEAFDQLSQ